MIIYNAALPDKEKLIAAVDHINVCYNILALVKDFLFAFSQAVGVFKRFCRTELFYYLLLFCIVNVAAQATHIAAIVERFCNQVTVIGDFSDYRYHLGSGCFLVGVLNALCGSFRT